MGRCRTSGGQFDGAPVDIDDGFIHFSTAEQVEETAHKHFRNIEDVLLLVVAVDILEEATQPIAWEPSRGGALFPHLYCPMPLNAVIALSALVLEGGDGLHTLPPLPQE